MERGQNLIFMFEFQHCLLGGVCERTRISHLTCVSSVYIRKKYIYHIKIGATGTSLAVQWLGLCFPGQWVAGSILGRGIGIPRALRPESQGIEQKQCCNRFNGDFEGGPRQRKNKKICATTSPLRINDGVHGK